MEEWPTRMPDLIAGLIAPLWSSSSGDLSYSQVMDLLYLNPYDAMLGGIDQLDAHPGQSTITALTADLPPHLFAEVPGVLDWLKWAGHEVAVTSNTPQMPCCASAS